MCVSENLSTPLLLTENEKRKIVIYLLGCLTFSVPL